MIDKNLIITKLQKNEKEILDKINRESISVYLFLKKEYKKGDIMNNHLFQFVYRSFYRLDNAGLGDGIKKRYFELLADKQNELETILLELYKIPTLKEKNSIQFSFATKLLHTLDNSKPIFDNEVSTVINKKVSEKEKESKIKSCIKLYEELNDFYIKILKDSRMKETISKFRRKFEVKTEEISDVKILDFIMWSLGKINAKK